MLDIGWPELLVVAIVLIVVVGPKDLPQMLRAFGRTTKKLRGMANEFRGQFDEALREADLDDVRKTISDARSLNPMNQIREAVNPLKNMGSEIRSDLEKVTKPDAPPVAVPDPGMKLDGDPPKFVSPAAEKAAAAAPLKGAVRAEEAGSTKAKAKPAGTAGTRTRAKTKAASSSGAAAKAKAATAKKSGSKPPSRPGTAKAKAAAGDKSTGSRMKTGPKTGSKSGPKSGKRTASGSKDKA